MAASSTAEQRCRLFSLAEIRSATGAFSNANVLGEGGFGKVYKGVIDDGSAIVAVKRLEPKSEQGRSEFVTEIETLTALRHRNIVSLIGYCSEQEEMILVYEFIANQTLSHHLHKLSGNSQSSLKWNEGLRILIGAARGLAHLHNGCPDISIIHRDVKSSNILLTEELVAKVSDFGLAKHLSADSSENHVRTNVKGSHGYIDPCFVTTGRLTCASDTYAFAVVMLEVCSRRLAFDETRPPKQRLLADWAREKIRKGKAREIVASNLIGEISKDCRKKFLEIAMSCLHEVPGERPTMAQVLAQLELALQLQQEEKKSFPFWRFLKPSSQARVMPSGPTQEDHNQVRVNMLLPEAIPAIQEDADVLEHEQIVDMLPVAIPVIPIEELEDRQNTNILPIAAPAIGLAELVNGTDNFSPRHLIANELFRGDLKSGEAAAIKRVNKNLPDREFLKQVSIISGLQHENVVRPLGYYVDDGLQVIAYEFAPLGSLHDILHGRPGAGGLVMEPGLVLSWEQRIKIAVGAAEGLCYIHDKALVHHSIKSNNVLLFEDLNAKISDVCLSTEYPCKAARGGEPYTSPLPSGCCYHPPECGWTSGKTQKGDVYSFGVVLLELLTGERPFDPTRPPGQQFLAIWATPVLSEDEIKKIVDSRLEGNYPLTAAVKVAAVAASCLEKDVDSRPAMSTVLRSLKIASWETSTCLLKRQQLSQRIESKLSPEMSAGSSGRNSSR